MRHAHLPISTVMFYQNQRQWSTLQCVRCHSGQYQPQRVEKLTADPWGNKAFTDLLKEYPLKDLEEYTNNLSESRSNNVKSRIRELFDQVFNEEIVRVENLKSLVALSSKPPERNHKFYHGHLVFFFFFFQP